ncbi:MAG: AAA family ATPase [Cellulomonadaceae bacterium]|jgi:wobble nucleotide-excising tRNase|nr:AAA family ATPase [Cellulomonadaceae bacterium]
MLRRIQLADRWRSLTADFWPEVPAGKKTVVYGHNGSGKSTIAELLLAISEDGEGSPVELIWEDETKHRSKIPLGGRVPTGTSISVFTRDWVNSNLAGFLDGEEAAAIVTLGKEAIDTKAEEAALTEEIEDATQAESAANKKQVAETTAASRIARDVQDRIVSELSGSDAKEFTKHRYHIRMVEEELRQFKRNTPPKKNHREALRQLGGVVPRALPSIAAPPQLEDRLFAEAGTLLSLTPAHVALGALTANPSAQSWVEVGVELHRDRTECYYCDGAISTSRRNALSKHFDKSWFQVREHAESIAAAVTDHQEKVRKWLDSLPQEPSVVDEFRTAYANALRVVRESVGTTLGEYARFLGVIQSKQEDPAAIPHLPADLDLSPPRGVTQLRKVVDSHNAQVALHDQLVIERHQIVLDYLYGSKAEEFRGHEATSKQHEADVENATRRRVAAERRVFEIRQQKFSTKEMADALTTDLARVYGKNHLSVVVTGDGKSYQCARGEQPATKLSEGERTTLALLYFLRKLEDQESAASVPPKRLVVIDDPSSSLDREAVFATHQWLCDRLANFGQYLVFTHDFSLLRLFLRSTASAKRRSAKKIKERDVSETDYPEVSYLESFASTSGAARSSRLAAMPSFLGNSTSEYEYLFASVLIGITEGAEGGRLFLLPNAARRILEVFTSYKSPHIRDFNGGLKSLVDSQSEPYRDVYDFCNRFSHGEGAESVDVLDAHAVHSQLKRCMEFLRAADSEHFERMCKAVNVDASAVDL